MTMRTSLTALALALALVTGCRAGIPDARFACDDDDDCPAGFTCAGAPLRCYAQLDAGRRMDATPDRAP